MQLIEGGCMCGAIRFRIQGVPSSSTLCHCASCRKAHCAPAVAWITIERAQLQLLHGSPAAFASSRNVVRKFCGACGSPLFYESAVSLVSIDVATLALNDAGAFPPTTETWLEHKLAWQVPIEGLQHFGRGSDAGGLPS